MLWILLGIAWWAAGSASFIHWWTLEFDLRSDDLVAAFLTGLLGPIAYPVGRWIHRSSVSKPRVFIKARTRP